MIMYNGKLFLPITMMCILDASYYKQECVPARTYLLNHDHLSPLILQSLFLRMQNPTEEEEEYMVQRGREEKRREEKRKKRDKRRGRKAKGGKVQRREEEKKNQNGCRIQN